MASWMAQVSGYFADHVFAAYVAVFVVSAGEALFVIGLFFPSTVVLLAAGSLVGAGKLLFTPVFLLTVLGAIVGDAISYWFGHSYKERVKFMWPCLNHPAAITKGEKFFARHGGMSVFLGRFVPGVKAVIPGIAGMMGMDSRRFTTINIVSAVAWAAVHLIPGIAAASLWQEVGSIGITAVAVLTGLVAVALAVYWYLHSRINLT